MSAQSSDGRWNKQPDGGCVCTCTSGRPSQECVHTCTCVCVSSVRHRGERVCLSVCVSMWWGCIELMAADISPRYSSHKSVSRSPRGCASPGAWCYQSETVATLSGQKSTEAFQYYRSWCQACSCVWRLKACRRSAVRRLGSGVGGCHITGQAVGLFTAGCC